MKLILSSFSIIILGILISYFSNTAPSLLLSTLAKRTTFSLRSGSNNTTINSTSLFSRLPFTAPSFFAFRYQSSNMTAAATTTTPRSVQKVFLAREQAEGAGATVRRSIGTASQRNLSPFLMLDHFNVSPGAGFPDHPHRGQETITYLLSGAVDHEDFAGHAGTIEAGDLQFMTAGRGIVHAEMPSASHAHNVGLQLWVDLPEKLKACEPRYRDLRAAEIPRVTADDGRVDVKVISGRSHGVDSVQELAYTPVWILDVTVRPGGSIAQSLPLGWNAFAYVIEGDATFGAAANATVVPRFHNCIFEREGGEVVASVPESAKEPARFVIIAGLPLDQNVVQYGPFVLNTKEEVYQAMFDYQEFKNGFERARDWESKIGKSMVH